MTPIRVLFLAASPNDRDRLRLDEEARTIEERIRRSEHRDTIQIITKWAVRPEDLQEALMQYRPHVVHFSGHAQSQGIILQASDGNARLVPGAALARMFETLKDNIRAVVFNACFSEEQAYAVTKHIDIAVGIRESIGDSPAIAFSSAFYMGLGFGRSVQSAFDVGINQIMLEGFTDAEQLVLVLRNGVDASAIVLAGPDAANTGAAATAGGYSLSHAAISARGVTTGSDEVRLLGQKLQLAYDRKKRLEAAGASVSEVIEEILQLKRTMRQGGRLKAGDSLKHGRYLLLQPFGRGGFATVWEALDQETQQVVAVKVLRNDLAGDPSQRARFFRGARVMATLSDSTVVRVLDLGGEDDGFCFFVMEPLHGGSLLGAVLDGKLDRTKAVPTILRVGDALAEAHRQGYVHRDVTPMNILLAKDGRVKLTDFDLVSHPHTTGGTRTGAMGTFLYAAPELLERPQDADARSDVYSLAMTTVFVLHGDKLPLSILENRQRFIKDLRCNDKLRSVLMKGVAWDRKNRFVNAEGFCHAVRIAAGRISKATPSRTIPSEKWVGVWEDCEHGSTHCMQVYNDQLMIAYCYGGRDGLTGECFDIETREDYLIAKFRWFADDDVCGYVHLRMANANLITGGWWRQHQLTPDLVARLPDVEDMVAVQLLRVRGDQEVPGWASSYFKWRIRDVTNLDTSVYITLCKIAEVRLRRSNIDLEPEELVHEAYLWWIKGNQGLRLDSHIVSRLAFAMRNLLIEKIRSQAAIKRGGLYHREDCEVDKVPREMALSTEDRVALWHALERLYHEDPESVQVVLLHSFLGLSMAEIAAVLRVSTRTIARCWRFARAWLRKQLEVQSVDAQPIRGNEIHKGRPFQEEFLIRYRSRRDAYLDPRAPLGECIQYDLSGRRLRIIRGDLVEQKVDAIVSSDDEELTMGGGVSCAIKDSAGHEVFEQVQRYVPVTVGRVVVTSGGRLSTRFIFHGVTMRVDERTVPSLDIVWQIMDGCFYEAETLKVRSIAFPLLGTGVGGLPRKACLDTMIDFLSYKFLYGDTIVQEARVVIASASIIHAQIRSMKAFVDPIKELPVPRDSQDPPAKPK